VSVGIQSLLAVGMQGKINLSPDGQNMIKGTKNERWNPK
jgi:hypothetical protein